MRRLIIWITAIVLNFPGHARAHGLVEGHGLQTSAPDSNKSADEVLPPALQQPARDAARAVIDQLKLWKVGSTLRVCFHSGSPDRLAAIAKIAQAWTAYANLKFDFGPPDTPNICSKSSNFDIKVSFDQPGYWSYVGTDSNRFDPSLNLEGLDGDKSRVSEQDFRRLILHEFGHALGFQHEHQSPEAKCSDEIDWPAAEQYYHGCCGWRPQEVHFNLETLIQSKRYRTTAYDPKSIMHYALPAAIFINGRNSRCFAAENYDLSPLDRSAAEGMYGSQQFTQDQSKEGTFKQLENVLGGAGLNDAEVRDALARVRNTFNIGVTQNNNAGRDVNAPVVNNQGNLNLSTQGPCSPAMVGVGSSANNCTGR